MKQLHQQLDDEADECVDVHECAEVEADVDMDKGGCVCDMVSTDALTSATSAGRR